MMIVAVLSICYKPGISNLNLVAGCIEAFIVSADHKQPPPGPAHPPQDLQLKT